MKPTVCCVMLVNGREAMTRRAIASFRAQTYDAKRLMILDSARECQRDTPYGELEATSVHMPDLRGCTVGALRNAANWCAVDRFDADLIAHWDSDDWSHPRRLEEQVALLESTGKMCVGYRDLLFWDTRPISVDDPRCISAFQAIPGSSVETQNNEAWLYRNDDPRWAAGASFLYRRELWERQPFDDAPHEDQRWWLTPLVSSQCVGTSALIAPRLEDNDTPRMICQIHGANTEAYDREKMLAGAQVWRRAPEYDQLCAERMKL